LLEENVSFKEKLYDFLAEQDVGREVVLFAEKC